MTARSHQKVAINIAMHQNLALFHDCGTGKTYSALRIIGYHRLRGCSPALVVCPLSVIEDAWIPDCEDFTPYLKIVSLWDESATKRRERLNKPADIYVTNYEGFKILYDDLAKKRFDIMVVDESSKMKDYSSKITKSLLTFAGLGPIHSKTGYTAKVPIKHRYVLSATPAPNDESEYWAQVKFITGPNNTVFDSNFFEFRRKYFQQIPLGLTGQNIYKFRKSLKKEFMDAMSPYIHVAEKNLNIGCTHQIRRVYLSREEQVAYDKMEQSYVLKYNNGIIVAENILIEMMKLRQLTSGFCYNSQSLAVKFGSTKFKELKDLLTEIGNEQVILWYNFKYEAETAKAMLSDSVILVDEDKDKAIKRFKAGKFKYLIANPKSAAHGIRLVNCRYNVYISPCDSYEKWKQSVDRTYREPQKLDVHCYYLIADKTYDEMVYKTVRINDDIFKETMKYLKEKNEKAKA